MAIPQKVIVKVFQLFFITRPAGHGTELGLSLSYDISKKLNYHYGHYLGLQSLFFARETILKLEAFNESIGKIEVIPQDVGRVLLNFRTPYPYQQNQLFKRNDS